MKTKKLSIAAEALSAAINGVRGTIETYERDYDEMESLVDLPELTPSQIVRDQRIAAEIREIASGMERRLAALLRKENDSGAQKGQARKKGARRR